ncbi:pseudouridine synthase [Curvibacter sp. RS43]|jgi:tRNA pseudouridine32 synthase/23S rRNA pseudouridine746 synthase|uniref:Pseudouridine synthase n=1 Tax=Curvibacter microcysteis TaxID=3026419 RepID=A0ABT5MG98_9BURK|nr:MULTISPECIES: pseudouridine synthase [unclassified Curvibacter]MDD0809854.1 pseudouridine synthase [Curvibacter sp. RS43]MDD0815029.1 pseudouridine synthase [Curvibacter sp. HBC28]
MHKPDRPQVLPTRQGVSPSCVAVPAGPWPTLLDFLLHRLPAVTREQWLERMAQGDVVDERGQPVTPERPFEHSLRLFYYRQLDTEPQLPFDESVVFQDEELLVADKPHFMPVTPGGRYLHETLLVRLKHKLGIDTLSPIHRIDRETAGLVLFSVNPATRGAYQALFRERQVGKQYEAIAPWRPGLSFPLRRQSRIVESEQFFRCCEVPGEPNADTTIEVQEVRGDLALYRLSPVTGKRHQLRVHMNALGLPILDDHFYPVVNDPPEGDYAQPLRLLARGLAFEDPVTGQSRRFSSGLQLSWPAMKD